MPPSSITLHADSPIDGMTDATRRSARRRRRHAADRRLRLAGVVAITVALGMLGVLLASLIVTGYPALTQTVVRVDFPVSEENVDPADPDAGNWRRVVADGVAALFPDAGTPAERRAAGDILTGNAQFLVRDAVLGDPSVIGGTLTLDVPAADPYDQLAKGLVDRASPEDRRRLSDDDIARFDALVEQGRVSRPLNWRIFTEADSRFPEGAGLAGALVGTFYVLLVCFLISFPLGIAAAAWLEEFAPKNRLTDFIEVNINNLAAVPSIVFGLLGLAVFIQTFGLPRSAPLVGGLVLALMTLPTIIIVTRAALKAVPPSIREAGLRHRRLQAPGAHAPRAAARDAGHPHRHDHRPRARPRRDRAAPPDRHERLHREPARRAPGRLHHAADPDLHLGRQPRARLRVAHVRRDLDPAGLLVADERHRHLPAPAPRAHLVARGERRA